MLKFNELKITPEDKRLIVDVSVIDSPYYKNVYVDSIIIDNQDTHTSNGPSTNPIFKYEDGIPSGGIITSKEDKRVRIEIPSIVIPNLDTDLFFIYVITKGAPTSDTPCGMDNNTIIGVAFDIYRLQNMYMNYLREVEDYSCNIPKTFIDQMLRFKAFKLSLVTGNHILAIKYWKKFFKNIPSYTITSKCPCSNV